MAVSEQYKQPTYLPMLKKELLVEQKKLLEAKKKFEKLQKERLTFKNK